MAEAITYADLRFVKAPLKNTSTGLGPDLDADEDGDLTYENVQVSPTSTGRSGLAYSGLGDKAGVACQQPEAPVSSATSPAARRLRPCRAAHLQYFLVGLLLTCLLLSVAATCLGVRYLEVSQQLQLVSGVLEATNSSLRQQLLGKIAQLGKKDQELQESKEDLDRSQQSRQEEQKVFEDTQEQLRTCQSEKEDAKSALHREEERRRNLEERLSRVQETQKFISCTSPDRCCPMGWVQKENLCFHLSLTRRTWDESREYCTSLSSDLATFRGSYPSGYINIAKGLFLRSDTSDSYWLETWTGLKLPQGAWWADNKKYSGNYSGKHAKLVFKLWPSLQEETHTTLLPCICQRATFRSPDRDGSLY